MANWQDFLIPNPLAQPVPQPLKATSISNSIAGRKSLFDLSDAERRQRNDPAWRKKKAEEAKKLLEAANALKADLARSGQAHALKDVKKQLLWSDLLSQQLETKANEEKWEKIAPGSRDLKPEPGTAGKVVDLAMKTSPLYWAGKAADKSLRPGDRAQRLEQEIKKTRSSIDALPVRPDQVKQKAADALDLTAQGKQARFESKTPAQQTLADVGGGTLQGLVSAASFGFAPTFYEARTPAGQTAQTIADIGGTTALTFLPAGWVGKAVEAGRIGKGLTVAGKAVASRSLTNLVTAGLRNTGDFVQGRQSLKDAFINTGLAVTGGITSLVPENYIRRGLVNVAAQYGTGMATEIFYDMGSGRVDIDKLFSDAAYARGYLKQKAINNAAQLGFGLKDNFITPKEHFNASAQRFRESVAGPVKKFMDPALGIANRGQGEPIKPTPASARNTIEQADKVLYHGTETPFEKFDTSRVNSRKEGSAGSLGWGIYFSDNPQSPRRNFAAKPGSKVYEVAIDGDANLLPMSEQVAEAQRNAILKAVQADPDFKTPRDQRIFKELTDKLTQGGTGDGIYSDIAILKGGSKGASELMVRAGIDGAYKNLEPGAGLGAREYVLYGVDKIKAKTDYDPSKTTPQTGPDAPGQGKVAPPLPTSSPEAQKQAQAQKGERIQGFASVIEPGLTEQALFDMPFVGKKPVQDPVLTLTAGMNASGKSTSLPTGTDAVEVNKDLTQNHLLNQDQNENHRAAKAVSLKQREKAISGKYNTIYDSTLTDFEDAVGMIESAFANGFKKVQIPFTWVKPDTALARAVVRRATGERGWDIPKESIQKSAQSSLANWIMLYKKYQNDPRVDFTLERNDRDHKPKIMLMSKIGGVETRSPAYGKMLDKLMSNAYNYNKEGKRYEASTLLVGSGWENLRSRVAKRVEQSLHRSAQKAPAEKGDARPGSGPGSDAGAGTPGSGGAPEHRGSKPLTGEEIRRNARQAYKYYFPDPAKPVPPGQDPTVKRPDQGLAIKPKDEPSPLDFLKQHPDSMTDMEKAGLNRHFQELEKKVQEKPHFSSGRVVKYGQETPTQPARKEVLYNELMTDTRARNSGILTDVVDLDKTAGNPANKHAIVWKSFTDHGLGNADLYKERGGMTRPQGILDFDQFGAIAAANHPEADLLKAYLMRKIGDVADKLNRDGKIKSTRTDLHLVGAEEVTGLMPQREFRQIKEQLNSELKAEIFEIPLLNLEDFQKALMSRVHYDPQTGFDAAGLKFAFEIVKRPEGSDWIRITDMSLSGGYGKDFHDADAALKRAKDTGKGAGEFRPENERLPEETVKPPSPDDMAESEKYRKDAAAAKRPPYPLQDLQSLALAVEPDAAGHIAISHLSDVEKANWYWRMVGDAPTGEYNWRAMKASGDLDQPQYRYDWNGLKIVNDVMGHSAGDDAVRDVTKNLKLRIAEELYERSRNSRPATGRKAGSDQEAGLQDAGRRTTGERESKQNHENNQELHESRTVSGDLLQGGEVAQAGGGPAHPRAPVNDRSWNALSREERLAWINTELGKHIRIYRDRSLKQSIVPVSETAKSISPEIYGKAMTMAARDVPIVISPKGFDIDQPAPDSFIRRLNEKNLLNQNLSLRLSVKSLQGLFEHVYGIGKKIQRTIFDEGVQPFIDGEGKLNLVRMPAEIGYGTDYKTAEADRNATKADAKKKNREFTLSRTPADAEPDPVKNLMSEGAYHTMGLLAKLPPQDQEIMIRNNLETDKQKTSAWLRRQFNHGFHSDKELGQAWDLNEILVSDRWMKLPEESRKRLVKMLNYKVDEQAHVSASGMLNELANKGLALAKGLTEPVPEFFSADSSKGPLFEFLGAREDMRMKVTVMDTKLKQIVQSFRDKLFTDALIADAPPDLKKVVLNKNVRDLDLLTDLAVHMYRDTTRNPWAQERIDANLKTGRVPPYWLAVVYLSRRLPKELRGYVDLLDQQYRIWREIGRRGGLDIKEVDSYANRFYLLKPDGKKKGKSTGSPQEAGFETSTDHSKERSLQSMLDIYGRQGELEIAGSSDALKSYVEDIMNALQSRQFIRIGRQMIFPDTLKPWFMAKSENPETYGYKKIETPGFKLSRFEKGKATNEDIYAPKFIKDHIDNIFAPAKLRYVPGVKQYYYFNRWAKGNVLVQSLFHYYNLILGGTLSTPHIGFNKGDPWRLAQFGQNLAKVMHPILELGMRNGMQPSRLADLNMELARLKAKGFNVKQMKKNEWQTRLFNDFGDGLKYANFFHNFIEHMKANPTKDPNQVAADVALMVNDNLGGLNYSRMGWKRDFLDFWSMVLFAPDWQMGNLRTAIQGVVRYDERDRRWQALGSLTGPYARFWAVSLAKLAIAANVMNMALNGRPCILDEKDNVDMRNMFQVDLTKVVRMMGEAKEMAFGIRPKKVKGRYYFDAAGWMMDIVTASRDPSRFVINKLAIVPRIGASVISGADYRSRPFTSTAELANTGHLVKDSRYAQKEGFWDRLPSEAVYNAKSVLSIRQQSLWNYVDGSLTAIESAGNILGMKVKHDERSPKNTSAVVNRLRNMQNQMQKDLLKPKKPKSWIEQLIFPHAEKWKREHRN